jgi:hypothetical protein
MITKIFHRNQPFDSSRPKARGLLRVDIERPSSPYPKGWVCSRRSMKLPAPRAGLPGEEVSFISCPLTPRGTFRPTFCILTFRGGWDKLKKIEELTYGN